MTLELFDLCFLGLGALLVLYFGFSTRAEMGELLQSYAAILEQCDEEDDYIAPEYFIDYIAMTGTYEKLSDERLREVFRKLGRHLTRAFTVVGIMVAYVMYMILRV